MLTVRPIRAADRSDVTRLVETPGATPVVSPSGVYQPIELPGFVATSDERVRGALTYRIGDRDVEIITLHAAEPGRGVGTALLSAARRLAAEHGARLWLITTDDNIDAQHFYERRGMRPIRVHRRFVDLVAAVKPDATLTFTDAIEYCD